MAAALHELDSLLDQLQAKLPQLVADCPDDGHFWMAFAGEADVIEDKADEHTRRHVMQRINAMLAEHGRYIAGIELEE